MSREENWEKKKNLTIEKTIITSIKLCIYKKEKYIYLIGKWRQAVNRGNASEIELQK